ncbi:MAG: tryptophan 2,3-dioxygenase family protein [Planctomycetota bacterium]
MAGRANYWDYIRVEELLSLQGGLERDASHVSNDELRFITIHQIDELWFMLVLRELAEARDLFGRDHVPETALASAVAALRRVVLIFDLAARHFRLMETMRTQDYLQFRDKLSPASGFQSAQFREIEILLGLDEAQRLAFGNESSYLDAMREPDGSASPALRRVQKRQAERPTLKDAVYAWLRRTPISGSSPTDSGDERIVGDFVQSYLNSHSRSLDETKQATLKMQALTAADEARLDARYEAERQQAQRYLEALDAGDDERASRRRLRAAILFVDTYRQLPLLSWAGEVVDALIELEQGLLVFRQRHARMVERVIGRRVGTGGSEGVAYLDRTALEYRVFGDLWAARTLLLQPDQVPPVQNAEFYGLRNS